MTRGARISLTVARETTAFAMTVVVCACGAMDRGDYRLSTVDERLSVESPVLSVRWTFSLITDFAGAYLPVENAAAALDPNSGKLFVGSTAGDLLALTQEGGELYRFAVGSAIESTPVLDPGADELYFGTTGGELVALKASAGTVRFRAALDGPVRQKPLLSRDTVYAVTDTDTVSAFARKDGEVLWRFRREVSEQFNISGHAGLGKVNGKLFTGLSDGTVVALDSSDGRLLWERDTSLDLEGEQKLRFSDVDTTPVPFEKQLLIASFSGGLYGLSVSSGAVLWRHAELTGVTAMARSGRLLVLSSAELGLVCMDLLEQRRIRWRRSLERGAPGKPRIEGETLFVGESEGGFMALSLHSGKEISRLEYGYGFSAPAALARGLGFVVSNGGTLLAFRYGH